MYCDACSPTFTDCDISENVCDYGGGGINLWKASPEFCRCLISQNRALNMGGGIMAGGEECAARFINCTIAGNFAPNGAGAYCHSRTWATFNSTIIVSSVGSGVRFNDATSCSFQYSDMYGNSGSDIENPESGPWGLAQIVTVNANGDSADVYENILEDPLFVNEASGNYHLHLGSPCVNAGDPALPLDADGSVTDMGVFPLVLPAGTGYVTLERPGPPDWDYRLHWTGGAISRLVFHNLCPQTHGSALADAVAAGWTATDFADSVAFVTDTPLTSGSLVTFRLSHPWCSDSIGWDVGDSSGTIDGPLPVEFTDFEAIAGDQSVSLRWRIASETDNAYFEVCRNELRIAEVPSRGSSATSREYSWTDRGLENGVTYVYRLACVDLHGRLEELGVRSATPRDEATLVSDYALHQNYPNPFNPVTSIAFDLVDANSVTLTVYDATGRAVAELRDGAAYARGHHVVEFDGGDLASGVYFCSIKIGNVFTSTKKMLLIR